MEENVTAAQADTGLVYHAESGDCLGFRITRLAIFQL